MEEIFTHRETLLKTALAICKDWHWAEDIVQDTYVDAFLCGLVELDALKCRCKEIAEEQKREAGKNPARPRPGDGSKDTQDLNDFRIANLPAAEDIPAPWQGAIDASHPAVVTFKDARAYVRELGLRNEEEWRIAHDKGNVPANIPKHPEATYKGHWQGWRDFLGPPWLSFEEARAHVLVHLVPNGIKGLKKYEAYAKAGLLPRFIPHSPDTVYREHWQGWGYWFGKADARSPTRKMLGFEDARQYVLNYMVPLGIDTVDKYNRYVDPPQCLPNDLYKYYTGKGWKGSSHFFETEKKPVGILKECADYKTVREWCRLNLRPLGIVGKRVFRAYLRGTIKDAPPWPENFPRSPEKYYGRRKVFVGYSDMLGVLHDIPRPEEIWPYEKARAWMIQHFSHIDIMTAKAWVEYVKGVLPIFDLPEYPHGMPRAPEDAYTNRKEWKGWPHFLGRSSQVGSSLKKYFLYRRERAKQVKMALKKEVRRKMLLTEKGIRIKENDVFLNTERPMTGKMLLRLLQKK